MKIESAERGGAEIHGEDVYKMGVYSFQGMKNKKKTQEKSDSDNANNRQSPITCYNCGNKTNNIKKHKTVCPAKTSNWMKVMMKLKMIQCITLTYSGLQHKT